MYIQLCNIDDCHGNDYDAFRKRHDRIGGGGMTVLGVGVTVLGVGVTTLAAVAMVMAGS